MSLPLDTGEALARVFPDAPDGYGRLALRKSTNTLIIELNPRLIFGETLVYAPRFDALWHAYLRKLVRMRSSIANRTDQAMAAFARWLRQACRQVDNLLNYRVNTFGSNRVLRHSHESTATGFDLGGFRFQLMAYRKDEADPNSDYGPAHLFHSPPDWGMDGECFYPDSIIQCNRVATHCWCVDSYDWQIRSQTLRGGWYENLNTFPILDLRSRTIYASRPSLSRVYAAGYRPYRQIGTGRYAYYPPSSAQETYPEIMEFNPPFELNENGLLVVPRTLFEKQEKHVSALVFTNEGLLCPMCGGLLQVRPLTEEDV